MNASPLSAFQSGFAAALAEHGGDAHPEGLDGPAATRFRIHRNNYVHGLGQELAAAYPVVRQLVGDDFFFAMARDYLAGHAPRSRSLTLFGEDFPVFLRHFPPAASVTYLPDMARLERARLEALHAADTVPLAPMRLAELGERLAETRFVGHPATRIVTSDFPILEIWQAHQSGTEPTGRPISAGGQSVLVTRPGLDVMVRPLSSAEAAFGQNLLSGDDVVTAVDRVQGEEEVFDLTKAFGALLAAGAFAELDATHQPHTCIEGS